MQPRGQRARHDNSIARLLTLIPCCLPEHTHSFHILPSISHSSLSHTSRRRALFPSPPLSVAPPTCLTCLSCPRCLPVTRAPRQRRAFARAATPKQGYWGHRAPSSGFRRGPIRNQIHTSRSITFMAPRGSPAGSLALDTGALITAACDTKVHQER